LRVRIELVDEKGTTLDASRCLEQLQQSQVQVARTPVLDSKAPTPIGLQYPWMRKAMDTWDIESLPVTVVELQSGIRMNRYPTLIVEKGLIRTALVDHGELAEIQFLPQWSSASLWLSDRFPSDRLRDCISDLMVRLAFVDTDWTSEQVKPVWRTKVEFDIARLRRVERISGAAAEIGRWLPKLADAHHKVRSALERTPPAWSPSVQVIREQVDSLYSDAISYHTPWCFVREMPRYLNAIVARLERLKAVGVTKDMLVHGSIEPYWQTYRAHLSKIQAPNSALQCPSEPVSIQPNAALLEYRWLIEELRVSLYAQQLGTRVSVSPKRLDKLKEKLS
jgi:ATP-dependent helicase HrpA